MHENDPAPHFDPLFGRLETIVVARDYDNTVLSDLVAAGAAAARAHAVKPEAMIAYLRHRVHEAPLAAVGDWYRGVIADRIISRAIIAYFDADSPADDDGVRP
jgi:hypothetical protein